MKKYSLSLVAPVFNEEILLENFIKKTIIDLEKVTDDYEIILVDDGSTDSSIKIANRLQQANNKIRVIKLEKNSGVGVATKIGLKSAKKEVIFNNTVDSFFETEELPRFLKHLETYSVVSGYRTNLASNNLYGKILTLGNYYLIRILFPVKLKAYQTVQFFKKPALDKINIESTTTFVAPELLIKASQLGYEIKEIGTEYRKRLGGKGKCGKLKHVFRSFRDIISFWLKWRLK